MLLSAKEIDRPGAVGGGLRSDGWARVEYFQTWLGPSATLEAMGVGWARQQLVLVISMSVRW
jgi:hypothetical protein